MLQLPHCVAIVTAGIVGALFVRIAFANESARSNQCNRSPLNIRKSRRRRYSVRKLNWNFRLEGEAVQLRNEHVDGSLATRFIAHAKLTYPSRQITLCCRRAESLTLSQFHSEPSHLLQDATHFGRASAGGHRDDLGT